MVIKRSDPQKVTSLVGGKTKQVTAFGQMFTPTKIVGEGIQ